MPWIAGASDKIGNSLDEKPLKQYVFNMKFEYDPQKSEANKIKHGVDFEEAKLVWDDEEIVLLASGYIAEERFLAIGYIYNKLWTVVFTVRGDAVRIISARRSRENEVAYYEKHKNH